MANSTTYTVNLLVKSKDEASKALGKTAKSAKKAKEEFAGLKKWVGAAAVAFGVLKVAQAGLKFVELGALVQRQAASLNSLAEAAGTSGAAITKAIQGASDYTIDRMSAMEAANKALVMDVAQTPEQFARLTKVAVALGRAMGVDATTSISDFTTAAARQSRMIADNLGLTVSAADANTRYATTLGKTAESLTDAEKKQAFLNEMLRQGEIKMVALGSGTIDTAGKVEQSKAAWADFKTTMAETSAVMAAQSGLLDVASEGMRAWANTATNIGVIIDHNKAKRQEETDSLRGKIYAQTLENNAMAANIERYDQYNAAIEESNAALSASTQTAGDYRREQELLAVAVGMDSAGAFNQYQAALDSTVAANDAAAMAVVRNREELERQTLATQSAAMAQMDLAAQLMGATEAQIAQAAIGQLKEALEAGEIDFATYSTAVQETQLAFGLADEASINLSAGLTALTESLAAGTVSASEYDEKLALLVEKSTAESAQLEALGVVLPTVSEGMDTASIATGGMQTSMDGLTSSAGASQGSVDALKGSIEALPSSKTITINIETRGSVPGMQHGGIARGGVTLVGERGPELVSLPGGSRVYNHSESRSITNNFTNNISGGGGAAILAAQQRAATRASFAGTT